MNHEKKLSTCLIIIIELYLTLNTWKKKGKGLKMLSPKLMLQRLPIALTQVKAGEKLLNKTRKIIYSFYWENEITKKVYNKILNLLKLLNRMDTIFMNSKNNKTSDPHRLLLNLIDKI